MLAALGEWLGAAGRGGAGRLAERDALRGRTVRWANGSAEGTAAGVSKTGALLVDTPDGRVTLDAGEVHLER